MKHLRYVIAGLVALVALFLAQGQPAYAVTITVNSTGDVIADDGVCTLREAITAANTDTTSGAMAGECDAGIGADTITLPAGTYTLTIAGTIENVNATGDLEITADLRYHRNLRYVLVGCWYSCRHDVSSVGGSRST